MVDQYPNLAQCRVELRSPNASAAPVRLPSNVLQAVQNVPTEAYDFSTEKSILQTHKDRMARLDAMKSDDPEKLQKAILVKMESVTNANEDVCVALLESNSYDLSTSIEAFYQAK